MSDERSLIFEASCGLRPEAGSLEEEFLTACSIEDERLWRKIADYPKSDIERAVANLRRLGWRFYLATVH